MAEPASNPVKSPLMQTVSIRRRCEAITRWIEEGRSAWWQIDRRRLPIAATEIISLMLTRFPDLQVPFHSRWRHFEAKGIDRAAILNQRLAALGHAPNSLDALRSRIDLCVISVLLDAGSGPTWKFVDAAGITHQRSEGLGVASFEAFIRGDFSSESSKRLMADARTLARMPRESLAAIFQHSPVNALEGLDGRLSLINRLGDQLEQRGLSRVSDLYAEMLAPHDDQGITRSAKAPSPSAAALLEVTITALANVWLKASTAPDGARGDLWPHPAAHDAQSGQDLARGWVPFHKLSQWLCYSLIEPFRDAGMVVTDLEALTGLPEYRNGGLLIDTGVITLRDPSQAKLTWTPADPLIIEWRALTVTLLDAIAEEVRRQLNRDATSLPLACILEGGSWAAGRHLAERLRGGRPPLEVDTAGSVF